MKGFIEKKVDINEQLHKTIRNMPYYSDFFSPILEIVPVELEHIDTKMTKSKDELILCRKREIGKHTLSKTLEIYKTNHPKLLSRYIKKCCCDLIDALLQLQKANIVDIEISDETIQTRDIDERPIIEIKEDSKKKEDLRDPLFKLLLTMIHESEIRDILQSNLSLEETKQAIISL